ncbi:MAG: sulfate transporter, partial [Verrucomicrobia bacterium]|nr:sulfate transporter [Verrucomicrobiota bacterium]
FGVVRQGQGTFVHSLTLAATSAREILHGVADARINRSVLSASSSYFAFRPKLVDCLRGYTRARFGQDILAGLIVGIVALPLAIGFGIASGATPAAGIITAVIGGFLVSLLGGSRVQIGGPAGAFVGLVYSIIARYGLPDLLVCTMMSGIFLFLLGSARLGSLIKFIPHPVTTGFTCGIAVTIMLTQVKDFLGLGVDQVPAEFFEKIFVLGFGLSSLNAWTTGIGIASVAVLKLWPKPWGRYVPASLVAVTSGTFAVWYWHLPVATILSRFGIDGIPSALPRLAMPVIHWTHLRDLVAPAIAITLMGSIESLLSAVVADGMIDDRHDSNQELKAQGIANFVSPLFGGIPVTGVIARTATNVRNGASTPVAGIVHSLTLLVIVLAAAPLARLIPLTVLGAVLIVVALNMGEWDEFVLLKRQSASDAAVFLVTFGLTVMFDLTVAVEVGMILAAVLFIKRVADTTQVHPLEADGADTAAGHEKLRTLPPGVLVYRVFGALMFGAADKLDNVVRRIGADTRVVILHMAAVTALDGTALNALENLHEKLRRHRRHLVLSGPHTQPYFLMEKAGFLHEVGEENVVADLDAALDRAKAILAA